MVEKTRSKPLPVSVAVNQCQAASSSTGTPCSAFNWFEKASTASLLSMRGSLICLAHQTAVLVVLDQVVVRVARESQGVEAQGVDDRQLQYS